MTDVRGDVEIREPDDATDATGFPPAGPVTAVGVDDLCTRIWDRSEAPERSRALVSIVASTFSGSREHVRVFVRSTLTSGALTPDELQEVMLAAAVYLGFPPIGTVFRPGMIDAARDAGVDLGPPLELGDPAGRHEAAAPVWEAVHAAPLRPLDDLLMSAAVEFVTGEVYSRPGLSLRDRRLIAITALTAQGLSWALSTHVRSALLNGEWESSTLQEIALLLATFVGLAKADLLVHVIEDVVTELERA